MTYDYDLIVLGAGPAGEKGAVQAAYFGKRVLVVERAQEPGGAAVHTGTLASTSMEQARVSVSHAFGFEYKRQVSTVIPFGIYTIPEVSCVDLSEEGAREKKIDYVVGRAFYRDNARGKIIGDKDGVIKLVFDKENRKLIGCHCIGDRASELVHIGQSVLMLGGTVDTFIEMVFNYPTLSELYKYAAYDALGKFTPR